MLQKNLFHPFNVAIMHYNHVSIVHTGLVHQCEPHRLLLQKRPLSEPSSAKKHLGLQPAEQNKAGKDGAY